ncbi:MAG: non-canonical purine NTP pyrophosphatase, partial [Candidatus Margulisiibacteriota bacterium]
MELLLATHNVHKVTEISAMLAKISVRVKSLQEIGYFEEIPETGETFRENAIVKARTVAMELGCMTLADDSGLEVDFLQGRPGVYSARYAGGDTSSVALCSKLLEEMSKRKPVIWTLHG